MLEVISVKVYWNWETDLKNYHPICGKYCDWNWKRLKNLHFKKQLFSALCERFQKEDHIGVHLSFLYLHNYVQFFFAKNGGKIVTIVLSMIWEVQKGVSNKGLFEFSICASFFDFFCKKPSS